MALLRRIALPSVDVPEFIVLGADIIRPILLIILGTLPSIIAYALCEQLTPARTKFRHTLFLAPVVLIGALGLAAQAAPAAYFGVPALYRWILLAYLLQIAPAYLVLILSGPR